MANLYIHIPFCSQACHYCDFHFSTSLKHKEAMLNSLCKEIELRKEELAKSPLECIYFGGGTPSLFSPDEIEQLITTALQFTSLTTTPEITLEANPENLSKKQTQAWAQTQVNRLSIGVQSFFGEDLKIMNRAHSKDQAKEALTNAAQYFDNFSLDLIYGFPDNSDYPNKWEQNIEYALSFSPPHISAYALTVEPKTVLNQMVTQKKIILQNPENVAKQHQYLVHTLQGQGYDNYEFSNFGKKGFYSRNNIGYWSGKPYIGIGPSAHSFDGTSRSWNVSNNALYIKSLNQNLRAFETEYLTIYDQFNEYLLTGLRMQKGISLSKIESRFGATLYKYLLHQMLKPLDLGLLIQEKDQVFVSKKGKFLTDGIASDLFFVD